MAAADGQVENPSKLLQADHITIGRPIGRGAFAAVYAGTYNRPGEPKQQVAIKVLQPSSEKHAIRYGYVLIIIISCRITLHHRLRDSIWLRPSKEEYTQMFLREAACTSRIAHK